MLYSQDNKYKWKFNPPPSQHRQWNLMHTMKHHQPTLFVYSMPQYTVGAVPHTLLKELLVCG